MMFPSALQILFPLIFLDGAFSQSDGDLRLVNGPTRNEGRVEIYHLNEWGTISYQYLISDIAAVVCRQLGLPFSEARDYQDASRYGQGTGPVWVEILYCTGNEAKLTDCRHFTWESTYFAWDSSHKMDIGVSCRGEHLEYGDLRLIDGPDNRRGRLEFYNGFGWGSFCDASFDSPEARVVCRQLGLNSSAPRIYGDAHFGRGSAGPYILRCSGYESKITSCYYLKEKYMSIAASELTCTHSQDIWICCGSDAECDNTTVTLPPSQTTVITAIVISVVVVLFICCCCYCCYKKNKSSRQSTQYSAVSMNVAAQKTTVVGSTANPGPSGPTQQYPTQGYNPNFPAGGGAPPLVPADRSPYHPQPHPYPSHPGQGSAAGAAVPSAPLQQGYPTAVANPYPAHLTAPYYAPSAPATHYPSFSPMSPPQPGQTGPYPASGYAATGPQQQVVAEPYPTKGGPVHPLSSQGAEPSAPPMDSHDTELPSMPPPSYDDVTS